MMASMHTGLRSRSRGAQGAWRSPGCPGTRGCPRLVGRGRTAIRWSRRWLPLLLLGLFFALGLRQAVRASITFDEGPHLAIGYATLRTGDLRLQPVHIHPPLANVLAAAPLLLQDDLPDPRAVDGWEIASLSAVTDAVVWSYPEPRRIAVAGRVPILLLGVLVAALVYRWAHDLGGRRAGLLALYLVALDPNVIAHAALITTDTAAVLLSLATLYALARFLRSAPGHPRRSPLLVASGVLAGLAQLAKVSALMLVPVMGLLLLIGAWEEKHTLRQALVAAAGRTVVVVAVAVAVLWAGYGFEVGWVEGWPLPVPAATHVQIYRSLNEHYELGHPTFALGQVSSHGWWWYFPLAFAVKTPLPTLLLGVAALVAGLGRAASNAHRARRTRTGSLAPIALFSILYAVASLFSSVNIGYRHLLPLLPFLAIVTGAVLATGRRAPWALAVLGIALIWLAAGTLRTLPYPLTFFNELAGGPAHGHRVLVDSNLDWGQNLWDLHDWMARNGEARVAYAHYSPARPAVYGIAVDTLPPSPQAVPYTPWRPAPGLYAIGATVLQGPYAPDINTYAWFRDCVPEAVLGNALFVYRVEPETAPAWALLCAPVTDAGGVRRRVGIDDLRVVQPLCDQALVYAAGQGLAVLAPAAPFPEVGDVQFALRTDGGETAAVVRAVSGEDVTMQTPAPDGSRFDGPLTFLGATEARSEAWTAWRVNAIPARPLSLMAHLLAADGTVVAVGDGLGFPIDGWQAGDVIVQRHGFDSTEGAVALEIGAYWLDTLERWPTGEDSSSLVVQLETSEDD